ncbi:DUF6624 domain-containing protein [Pedobacter sp. SYSU D00535]|uniref:DUF6624 domain-containing protein n=1 Tax=Pedobacter sp. SYSU D00535 TaxID=2810308 RepID=UPI001A957605|nr:DUF6624 domain-containing protein [Pedobacter sp. SYSU D00535]
MRITLRMCCASAVSLLMSAGTFLNAQHRLNLNLKRELDSIYTVDQKYRGALSSLNQGANADSIAAVFGRPREGLDWFLMQEMGKADSANLVRVRGIIKSYGYPGKTLVGVPANETAWYVIQHSSFIKEFIPHIKQAAKEKELPYRLYAQMADRLLMQEGKEQLYGTQVYGLRTVNRQTGKEEWKTFVWPIKKPKNVNRLRRKAGFPKTIEEHAASFGLEYKLVTLEEVRVLEEHIKK